MNLYSCTYCSNETDDRLVQCKCCGAKKWVLISTENQTLKDTKFNYPSSMWGLIDVIDSRYRGVYIHCEKETTIKKCDSIINSCEQIEIKSF